MGGDGVIEVLAGDVPDPRWTHWPLEAGKAFSLDRAMVLISPILLHAKALGPGVLARQVAA